EGRPEPLGEGQLQARFDAAIFEIAATFGAQARRRVPLADDAVVAAAAALWTRGVVGERNDVQHAVRYERVVGIGDVALVFIVPPAPAVDLMLPFVGIDHAAGELVGPHRRPAALSNGAATAAARRLPACAGAARPRAAAALAARRANAAR